MADFYESALGFQRIAVEHLSGARAKENFGIGGRVLRVTLALGMQRVTLVQFVDQPGEPYPDDARSSDLIFQHFAIVVSDMAAAMAQLQGTSGWTPITRGGSQQLPASSGGVTAFKFRDPEGHPLELLAFPSDRTPKHWQGVSSESAFLGIDHSAISVRDTARSVAYYAALGLDVSTRSINDDPAQVRLDHLDHPVVDVTAMSARESTPHLELLCYRDGGNHRPLQLQPNDVAATCLVFGVASLTATHYARALPVVRHLQDPDGHHLAIVDVAIE